MIYWFTGQPGSGKTTLAFELMKHLPAATTVHIDGDHLRDVFKNKDYSEAGRRKNIERAQDIAKFLNTKGYSVIVSLVSPYKDQRDKFKSENSVVEIYVHTTETRGREHFAVDDYEPPTERYLDMNTTDQSIEESTNKLLNTLFL